MTFSIVIVAMCVGLYCIFLAYRSFKSPQKASEIPLEPLSMETWKVDVDALWVLSTKLKDLSAQPLSHPTKALDQSDEVTQTEMFSKAFHFALKVIAPSTRPFERMQLDTEFEKWGFCPAATEKDTFEKILQSNGSVIRIILLGQSPDNTISSAADQADPVKTKLSAFRLLGEYTTRSEGEILLNTLIPLGQVMARGLDGILTTESGEVFTDAEFFSYQEALRNAPEFIESSIGSQAGEIEDPVALSNAKGKC